LAVGADAQVTRTATFENYSEGQTWSSTFTDPFSGIGFRNSTHPIAGAFVVEYSSTNFGAGNYLTSGGYSPGPIGGFGSYFGFTADLPAAADRVSMQVSCIFESTSNVQLIGFNSKGDPVAAVTAADGLTNPFTLEIDSARYDITTFRVSVNGGAEGYDNISYTILPEPSLLTICSFTGFLGCRRRRIF
jgi:hypothetical protein